MNETQKSRINDRLEIIRAARLQVEALSASSRELLRLEFQRAEEQAQSVIFQGAGRSY